MNRKIMKAFGCFAAVLMVLGLFTAGAVATEDTESDRSPIFKIGEKHKFGHGFGVGVYIPLTDAGEPDLDSVKERSITVMDTTIEKLESIKTDIDDLEDETVTVESIDELILRIESVKEDISNAEEVNDVWGPTSDFREILVEMNEMGFKRSSVNEQAFESEEEAFEFYQNRLVSSLENRIERLESLKENLDEVNNEELTAEMINDHIAALQLAKESVSSAEDRDAIKEAMEQLKSGCEDLPGELKGFHNGMGHGDRAHAYGMMSEFRSANMGSIIE